MINDLKNGSYTRKRNINRKEINDGQICPGLSLLFNSISGPQVCVRPVLDHYRKDGAENTSSCWIKDWLNTQTSIGPFEICWMNVDLLWLDSKSAKPNYHKLKAFCFSNLLIESVQLSFFLSFSFLYRIEPDWVDGRMMAQIKSFCPSQTLQANWSPTQHPPLHCRLHCHLPGRSNISDSEKTWANKRKI